MKRFTFKYAYWATATVTVYAKDLGLAIMKARDTMDRRYEKAGKEPPVAWNLELVGDNV